MFEREVMITSLKRQSEDLKRLVEELEERPDLMRRERQYCFETMKKVETMLRKLRKMGDDFSVPFNYNTHPLVSRVY